METKVRKKSVTLNGSGALSHTLQCGIPHSQLEITLKEQKLQVENMVLSGEGKMTFHNRNSPENYPSEFAVYCVGCYAVGNIKSNQIKY